MEALPRLALLALLALALVACASAPAAAPPTSVSAPPPTVSPDLAYVGGRVLSSLSGEPIYRVRVAFAEVIRDGESAIYVDDAANTPFVETDQAGNFVMPDLAPKEYVIVVGDPFGLNEVIRDTATGLPRVWLLEAGKPLDVGELRVDIGY